MTVFSTTPNKRDEALKRLGADQFVVSKDENDMKVRKFAPQAAAARFSGIRMLIVCVLQPAQWLLSMDSVFTVCVIACMSCQYQLQCRVDYSWHDMHQEW